MVVLILVLVLVVVMADTTYSSSTSSKQQHHLLACDLVVVDRSSGFDETGGEDTAVGYFGGEIRSNRTNTGINGFNERSDDGSTGDTCRHGHDVCRDAGNSTKILSRGRVVVIGDVHGSYEGLLELLYYSNITASEKSCRWREQAYAGRCEG